MPSLRPRSSQRGRYLLPELRMAAGPLEIATPAGGTFGELYGRAWALEVPRSGPLRFFRLVAGAWEQVTAALPELDPPADARRFSLAFDQNARVIVAWQEGETVKATRWDTGESAYVQNVEFHGINPVLLMDALVNRHIADSDIILFHQKPADLARVYVRTQRESYGDETHLFTAPWPILLDYAQPLYLRYQLLGADADGDPVPAALRSELYPFYVTLPVLTGAGAFASGDYVQVATKYELALPGVEGAGAFTGGDYTMDVELYELTLPTIEGEGRFAGGEYVEVVTIYELTLPALTGEGRFSGGDYPEIATKYELTLPALEGEGRFSGGSYATP